MPVGANLKGTGAGVISSAGVIHNQFSGSSAEIASACADSEELLLAVSGQVEEGPRKVIVEPIGVTYATGELDLAPERGDTSAG